jgi:hypothetical protein
VLDTGTWNITSDIVAFTKEKSIQIHEPDGYSASDNILHRLLCCLITDYHT